MKCETIYFSNSPYAPKKYQDAMDLLIMREIVKFEKLCTKIVYVTQSGKTNLITYLKVSRNTSFKYKVFSSSPMHEATCTKFSHVLYQFLTFQSIHCSSSQQLVSHHFR